MLSVEEAREFLRIDNEDNDLIIDSILKAIPSYIELSTGLNINSQDKEPMAIEVSKHILSLWFNAEQTDHDKIQNVIDSLLKAIKFKNLK